MRQVLVFLSLALLFGGAAAPLQQAGSAVRTKFFTDLYRITIFDDDGAFTRDDLNEEDAPLRIELDVLYGGDVPDIPEGWSSELMPVIPEKEMADLRRAYRSLQKDDRIVLTYDRSAGTAIAKNGWTVVDEPGYELTSSALEIWFGESPVSGSVRHSSNGKGLNRFNRPP